MEKPKYLVFFADLFLIIAGVHLVLNHHPYAGVFLFVCMGTTGAYYFKQEEKPHGQ